MIDQNFSNKYYKTSTLFSINLTSIQVSLKKYEKYVSKT